MKKRNIKHLAAVALLFAFVAAAAYAQPGQINMTVSGSGGPSAINLQPGKGAAEYQLAGNGNLGPFTLRVVSAGGAPQQNTACSGPTKLYVPVIAGGALARFENGDILKGHLTGGSDCIDFAAGQAICVRIFQILGGTGRFNGTAGGTLTLTMTVVPVAGDSSNNPVFFAVTGGVTGSM